MELPDDLLCLFSAQLDERAGTVVIEVPKREIEAGVIAPEGTYRVALLPPVRAAPNDGVRPTEDDGATALDPPVAEEETRRVEIEDIGDQGDGITRVERGFVVIVPDTEPGERVEIEITEVRENLAFGEVLEREDYR